MLFNETSSLLGKTDDTDSIISLISSLGVIHLNIRSIVVEIIMDTTSCELVEMIVSIVSPLCLQLVDNFSSLWKPDQRLKNVQQKSYNRRIYNTLLALATLLAHFIKYS